VLVCDLHLLGFRWTNALAGLIADERSIAAIGFGHALAVLQELLGVFAFARPLLLPALVNCLHLPAFGRADAVSILVADEPACTVVRFGDTLTLLVEAFGLVLTFA